MKIVARTMAGIGIFAFVSAVVYWFLSYEESGSVLLVAVTLSTFLLAAYLLGASRRGASLPEDRRDGAAPDEEDVGVFPSASIWPAVLGGGISLAAFGFAYDEWLALPGLGLLVVALGGMVIESVHLR